MMVTRGSCGGHGTSFNLDQSGFFYFKRSENSEIFNDMESQPPARRQGIYWIATIPYSEWKPELASGVRWAKGQHERGDGGFEHWQVIFAFERKKSLVAAKTTIGVESAHLELCRSAAADDYVWKEETRVGEMFELGSKAFQRNRSADWDLVRAAALAGDFGSIPADIYVRYYSNLCKIRSDNLQPVPGVRTCKVFWGKTGVGKSRRAWEEGGSSAYAKDPRTKFWCGYLDQPDVIIDEFRGGIDIAHVLRWTDRYPVRVEVKGGSRPLAAKNIWFTSNLHPSCWYPDLDRDTYEALERRLTIEELV